MSFSPDADYPVINAEKGIFTPGFHRSWPASTALPRVTRLRGGKTRNAVPALCEAVVEGLPLAVLTAACQRWNAANDVRISAQEEDGATLLTAQGLSAHACEPEKGRNALTALLALLSALPLAPGPSADSLRALADLFPHGDCGGAALGIDRRDDITGELTLTLSILELCDSGFSAQFDCRAPLDATQGNMADVVLEQLRHCGFTVDQGAALRPGHFTPPDSRLCRTLNRIYEANTGLPGGCVAIGGYTYAHDIPGGVAFGCAMPGAQPHFHTADERMDLGDLMLSAKMFTQAIWALCGENVGEETADA